MPDLIVIAGCNGAGKSIFAPALIPEHITSFDFDKRQLEYYNSLPDSEFRDKFAKDKTIKDFEKEIAFALENGKDFCYETNFDANPIHWPEIFKKRGFILKLIFFCLENRI